jgi:hypothetical protein
LDSIDSWDPIDPSLEVSIRSFGNLGLAFEVFLSEGERDPRPGGVLAATGGLSSMRRGEGVFACFNLFEEADATSMYTNIDTRHALATIDAYLQVHQSLLHPTGVSLN